MADIPTGVLPFAYMAFEVIARWAKALKRDVRALAIAYKAPETPWYARAFAALVVAYALSPIDLIPDFIPILGYLDDVLLIPLGIAAAIRMIPSGVMDRCREEAERCSFAGKPKGRWIIAALIVTTWALVAFLAVKALWSL
jgi:uncharacterized membrane protein YkvA (DUF1232 family)